MKELVQAVETVLDTHRATNKPLAIILAGHNGSGKSTMWRDLLGPKLQIPLLNADRMMMSILPEIDRGAALPGWAQAIRDTDEGWMGVAQRGVQAFVGQAMSAGVPFAMETVFSHWKKREDGTYESKIDNIRDLQEAGYFVLQRRNRSRPHPPLARHSRSRSRVEASTGSGFVRSGHLGSARGAMASSSGRSV